MFWKRKEDCHRFGEMLSSYIDGQVTPGEKKDIEAHLASCSKCCDELESLRTTVGLLRRVPLEELPRNFTVAAKPATAPGLLVPMRWASAAAVVVLALVLAGDLFNVYPEKSSPKETPSIAYEETRNNDATTPPGDTKIGAFGGVPGLVPTATAAPVPEGQTQPVPVPTASLGAAPVSPSSENTAVDEPASDIAQTMTDIQKSDRWPIRSIEYGVLGAVVLMLATTLILWKKPAKSTVKVKIDKK